MGADYKTSTVTLKVDLDCKRCYKKITKTICKLQERESIQSIILDVKKNTVTISGPFEPKSMCSKLCCKAGNVIKDIQIKDDNKGNAKEEKPKTAEPGPAETKKDKPKKEEDKPKEKEKEKPAKDDKPKEKEKEKEKPAKDDKPKEKEKAAGKDEPKKDAKPSEPTKPKDAETKKFEMYPPGPGMVWTEPAAYMTHQAVLGYHQPPSWSAPGYGEGYGWVPHGQPPVVYGTPVYAPPTYADQYSSPEYFSEEDQQSCSIM